MINSLFSASCSQKIIIFSILFFSANLRAFTIFLGLNQSKIFFHSDLNFLAKI